MSDVKPPLRRIYLGPSAFLPRVGFVAVPIVPPHKLPDTTLARSALVGFSGGEPRAFANLCRHLAIPLDYGDGDVTDLDDSAHLRCRRHGAIFAASDGLCVVGPCLGKALWRLAIEIDDLGDATLVLGGERD
jgi:nitrite reductase/ring-hydroxylating ferredoxin subunit